jgi:glycosyltransferase involved in cell wall biosynthesis
MPDRVNATNRLLINAANLHTGGGVQVATSFLSELAHVDHRGLRIEVIASSEVVESLRRQGSDTAAFYSLEKLDAYGAFRGNGVLRRRLRDAETVFTVFGPLYVWPKPPLSIVGFAQAWIAYPDNEAYGKLPWLERTKTRLKFFLQGIAFRHTSDVFFVEAAHIRPRLAELGLMPADLIHVVPNSLNEVFLDRSRWGEAPTIQRRPGALLLGIVSRDYSHKNLDILPALKTILARDYSLEVDFAVTLTPQEWARRSDAFREATINVGPLTIDQCPLFYEQLDGVIFPSLLETFSATPLEAMYMRKPLFASDRPFVRDLCGNFPWYFDPNSPNDAARAIAEFAGSESVGGRINAAHEHVLTLPTARRRAQAYLDTIAQLMADRIADKSKASSS